VRVTSLGGGKRVSQPPVPEGRTSDKMNVASIRSFYKLITRAVCYKLSFDATAPLKTLPPRSFARSLADRHLRPRHDAALGGTIWTPCKC